jgi:pseudouridine synthase
VPREYHARVRGIPDDRALRRLARGVVLDGRKTAPAEIAVVERGLGQRRDQALLSITLHEGRRRQVRRMCEAVGHPIVRLRRVRFGPIADDHLKVGTFRSLTSSEVAALRKAASSR